MLSTFSGKYNDVTRKTVSLSRSPQAASWKELNHFAQEAISGKFERFDYGPDENLVHYGQKTPPEIDITAIHRVPVAMFVGKQDPWADLTDVSWAYHSIPSAVHYQEIDNCDHSTYLLGKDVSFMDDVKKLVAKYN